MPLSIDSTCKGTTSGGSGSITTSALTTTGTNKVLIAFCGGDGTTGVGDGHVTNITGGPGGWTQVNLANSQAILGNNSFNGWVSVWRAIAPAKLTAATFTMSFTSGPGWILIVAFDGADLTGTNGSGAVGATAIAGAATGAPSQGLATTDANSWVWGSVWDWSNNVTPAVPANQTLQDIFHDSVSGDSGWTQYFTNKIVTPGTTVTINNTSPTTDEWALAMIEISPSTAVAPTPVVMMGDADFQFLGGERY